MNAKSKDDRALDPKEQNRADLTVIERFGEFAKTSLDQIDRDKRLVAPKREIHPETKEPQADPQDDEKPGRDRRDSSDSRGIDERSRIVGRLAGNVST